MRRARKSERVFPSSNILPYVWRPPSIAFDTTRAVARARRIWILADRSARDANPPAPAPPANARHHRPIGHACARAAGARRVRTNAAVFTSPGVGWLIARHLLRSACASGAAARGGGGWCMHCCSICAQVQRATERARQLLE